MSRLSPLYTVILTTSAQLSRVLSGFLLLKMLAYYFGVAGLGMLGNFMTLVAIASLLGGGGVINGVIKYVAEYKSRPKRMFSFIKASAIYSSGISILLLFVGILFSVDISKYIFGNEKYYWIIVALGFAQVGFGFSNLVAGVINGYRETVIYAKLQIIGNLLGFPIIYVLLKNYGIPGAALGIIVFYLSYVIPAYYFYYRSPFRGYFFNFQINLADYRKLFSFTAMIVVSALAFPVVEMIIRQEIISSSGYSDAGLWQGAIRLSAAYLGFFSIFFAYYLVPVISSEEDKNVIRRKVLLLLLGTASVYIVGASSFYFLRQYLIPFFLSSEFYPLNDLMVYQLVGDFFRVLAYCIGFVAVAKAATKLYILSEVIQSVSFLSLSIFFGIYTSQLHGVFFGYVATYMMYFFLTLIVFLRWTKT